MKAIDTDKCRFRAMRIRPEYVMLAPSVVWIAVFLIIPVIILTVMSFYTLGLKGGMPVILPELTVENYIQIFTNPVNLSIIVFTVTLSLLVTALCILIAYPAAYFFAIKIKSPAIKTLILLLLLPYLWIDYTARTIAWFPILGVSGMANYVLMGLGVLNEPSSIFFFNEFSATLVMTQTYVLFMVFPIFLSMAKIDPTLLHAAETLGANRRQAFYNVTFRMSLPGLVVGCIFVFVFAMADFATPRLLGGTIQTAGLSIAYLMGVLSWPLATAFATVLIGITLGVVYLFFRIADVKSMVF
ncbi:MAG: ABC transporter permease [Candidatus Bathyarchaeia archaeon]